MFLNVGDVFRLFWFFDFRVSLVEGVRFYYLVGAGPGGLGFL